MYQKAEGRFEQLPGYEAGSCGAGEKEEMIKMRDNGCSGWSMNFRVKKNTANGKNGFKKQNRREHGR